MGIANYLAKFMPQLATITTPLKELQKERNDWIWAEPQETAFLKLKEILSYPEVLAQYSNTAETRVAADASPYGIGAVLTQKQADGSWRPVTYISRGLTDTEKRYAQIEKEALAVTWACERLASYLLGLHFTLMTDHKPLVPLLSTRGLDDPPPRILRFASGCCDSPITSSTFQEKASSQQIPCPEPHRGVHPLQEIFSWRRRWRFS